MLKFKYHKTTTIRFLIIATKTKNNTYFFVVVHMLDNMISYYFKK